MPHPKNKTPPNLQDLLRQWFYQRFGLRGLLILAVVSASFFLWWNWEKVRALPGVSAILSQLSRQSLPEADPNRFSIAIAHLENDKDRQHENLVVESLKEFKGVQVLRLDRTISLEGAVPEETEKAGHDKAREYLQATGADVLIWGLVVAHAGRTIPKLYWTVGRDRTQRGRSQRYSPAEDLRLPEIFWQDLVEVLRLLIVSHHSEFGEQEGRYLADKVRPFIAKVRHIVETGHVEKGWRPEDLVLTKFILANSLTALGNQAGDQAPLKEATDLYRSILKEFRRERVPQAWATAQNNLGNALSILGAREASTERLKDAVAAYREALKERTRDRIPLAWAATQSYLGNALRVLGEREASTERLREAVEAYREALKERTREKVPLDWGMTQDNLGSALSILGQREVTTERLKEAVAAYREALKERTRDRIPLAWAMTQNNLGNALSILGQREVTTERLKEAIAAYREALKEWTRERVPLNWATAQNNLGNALRALGEREASTERLKEAVAVYREALKERTRERVPLHWADTQNNLGNVLQILGNRLKDDGLLCEALGLHAGAWKVWFDAGHVYAKWGVAAVDDTLKRFKSDFGPQAFRLCLQKHPHFSDLLRKMGKTS